MIYVGRWELLPKGETIYGSEDEVLKEVSREIEEWDNTHEAEDNNMGVYSADEFEDAFNNDDDMHFTGAVYWVRMFV